MLGKLYIMYWDENLLSSTPIHRLARADFLHICTCVIGMDDIDVTILWLLQNK